MEEYDTGGAGAWDAGTCARLIMLNGRQHRIVIAGCRIIPGNSPFQHTHFCRFSNSGIAPLEFDYTVRAGKIVLYTTIGGSSYPLLCVGLWRSWERASMAWKRSSVRSRPGPPNLSRLVLAAGQHNSG